VRLIPHYSLAVWALFIHLGCGLRGVLLSHRTSVSAANASAWGVVGLGAAIAATIIVSMCRLHIRWTFETLVELSHDPRKIGPLSCRR
jgi:hypothetical protein